MQTNIDAVNRPDTGVNVVEPSGAEEEHDEDTDDTRDVYIMNPKHEDRASSFFAQPGVLAGMNLFLFIHFSNGFFFFFFFFTSMFALVQYEDY